MYNLIGRQVLQQCSRLVAAVTQPTTSASAPAASHRAESASSSATVSTTTATTTNTSSSSSNNNDNNNNNDDDDDDDDDDDGSNNNSMSTFTAPINTEALLTVRRFLVLAVDDHSPSGIQLRFLLLRYYLAALMIARVENNNNVGKSLTRTMGSLDAQAVLMEMDYFRSNFTFSNHQQQYVVSESVHVAQDEQAYLAFARSGADWGLSNAEWNAATLLFLVSGCVAGKHPAVCEVLCGESSVVDKDVAEMFLNWVTTSAHAIPSSVKDAALHAFIQSTDPSQLAVVIQYTATTVNALRERSLRRKWCRDALGRVRAHRNGAANLGGGGGGGGRGGGPNRSITDGDIQKCIVSIAVTSFNDGVGLGRESLLIEAESCMSVAVSLLAPLPPSELKRSISKGYELILRLLQESKAANATTTTAVRAGTLTTTATTTVVRR